MRTPRGFTLIEVMTVVAILGVLAALSVFSIRAVLRRSQHGAATWDLVSGLRQTRAEAYGRGRSTAFVLDTAGGRWWGLEVPTGWSLTGFDPSAPGKVIVQGALPKGMAFGPKDQHGQALPSPFTGVPMTSAAVPNLPYCSFCAVGGALPGYGAILFAARGGARFDGTVPGTVGQQFRVTARDDGGVERVSTVAVMATTGLVELFERT